MKFLCKAFRHSSSLQIIIPKKITEKMGWNYNTYFILENIDEETVTIKSLDMELTAKAKVKKEIKHEYIRRVM